MSRLAVVEYIEGLYKRKRIRSVLGYRSPVDYEEAMPSTRAATPAA